ncbi:hypothetical protein GLW05_19645 [Pontibacillus yanchengensis]|uniref:Beta-lactamase class A catalytic domain-containing protein n=1 Tax=Pontibacillus yanchengensis TaxID=462910 RepID=A0A6I5A686_9BACI|nr:serine hydrolase [Pontibacillus yanchengensis]MYL35789.1 hypothetical protein [Pontibacillus yanchengensis]
MCLSRLENEVTEIVSKLDGNASVVIQTINGTIAMNEKEVMPAASVIKIPIMMEAFRQAKTRGVDLSATVTIPQHNKVGGAGVLQFLSQDAFPLHDLVTMMIIVSDNVASNAVIKHIGIGNVNHLIEELGCSNTKLRREFMDLKAQEQGLDNTTTAEDMVKLLEQLTLQDREMVEILKGQQLTSQLPAYHTYEDLEVANKTGELDGVNHDVGILIDSHQTVYVAVLLNDVRDTVEGQRAIADIGNQVMQYMKLG